jgi:hypothetical protein
VLGAIMIARGDRTAGWAYIVSGTLLTLAAGVIVTHRGRVRTRRERARRAAHAPWMRRGAPQTIGG